MFQKSINKFIELSKLMSLKYKMVLLMNIKILLIVIKILFWSFTLKYIIFFKWFEVFFLILNQFIWSEFKVWNLNSIAMFCIFIITFNLFELRIYSSQMSCNQFLRVVLTTFSFKRVRDCAISGAVNETIELLSLRNSWSSVETHPSLCYKHLFSSLSDICHHFLKR